MSVIALFLLSSLGIAMTVQAQECSMPVGGPNMDLTDDDIDSQSFPDGKEVTFTCNIGYRPAGGSGSITCTAGSWSPVGLTCKIKLCGSAGEVINGDVDYPNGTAFGAEAVVICKAGFRPVGQGRFICGDKGWYGKLKTCEVTKCYPPTQDPGVTFDPVKEYYEYNEVLQLKCPKDLIPDGSTTLTCSDDGTFQPKPPKCIEVECETPYSPVRNTEYLSGARSPYRHKNTVTLQCKSGYTMKGLATVTCEINNKWSPPLPVCELKAPPTKPTIATKTTTSPPSTKGPTGDGDNLPKIFGIVFGVLISVGLITIGGCYCFGVPGFIRRKRGHRRDITDKEAPHDGEDVALS